MSKPIKTTVILFYVSKWVSRWSTIWNPSWPSTGKPSSFNRIKPTKPSTNANWIKSFVYGDRWMLTDPIARTCHRRRWSSRRVLWWPMLLYPIVCNRFLCDKIEIRRLIVVSLQWTKHWREAQRLTILRPLEINPFHASFEFEYEIDLNTYTYKHSLQSFSRHCCVYREISSSKTREKNRIQIQKKSNYVSSVSQTNVF